jgi:hypothetical protein
MVRITLKGTKMITMVQKLYIFAKIQNIANLKNFCLLIQIVKFIQVFSSISMPQKTKKPTTNKLTKIVTYQNSQKKQQPINSKNFQQKRKMIKANSLCLIKTSCFIGNLTNRQLKELLKKKTRAR